jgi:hypothetical protein
MRSVANNWQQLMALKMVDKCDRRESHKKTSSSGNLSTHVRRPASPHLKLGRGEAMRRVGGGELETRINNVEEANVRPLQNCAHQ